MRSFLNCLLGPRKASVTTSNGYSKEKSPQDQSIGTCRLLGSSDKPGEQPNGCADAKHNSALVCYQGQHGEVAVLQAGVNGFQPSASPLNTFEQGAYAAGDAEPSTVNALKLQVKCILAFVAECDSLEPGTRDLMRLGRCAGPVCRGHLRMPASTPPQTSVYIRDVTSRAGSIRHGPQRYDTFPPL